MTKTPKKTNEQPQNATPKALKDFRVRVRMYRQGLGDCFLLSFRKERESFTHVMIDCGVVLGTKRPEKVMKKVAENLRETTNGKIDVLVITHEHWDHLSGFTPKQAQAELDGIDYGQLWLAWTEDEQNDLANALRKERALKKAAAAETKKRLEKSGEKGAERAKRLGAVLEFNGPDDGDGGEGAGGTAGALKFLKKKIAIRRTLKPGGRPISVPGLDGVRIYIMGPPEDRARLHKTNPGKSQGYGLAEILSLADSYVAALGLTDKEGAQPFAKPLRKPMSDMEPTHTYLEPQNNWRKIDDDWLAVGERLALQLDNDTNNTSLVLAFEFIETEEVLLFVGDAQAGNWLSWDDHKWEIKEHNGGRREVTAADLLTRTVLYKVGHHGSHNATLRTLGLERMTSPNLVAMMPVDENVAHNIKKWLHMPLLAICNRLKQKCRGLIRVDKDAIEGTDTNALRVVSGPGKLYFDYYL